MYFLLFMVGVFVLISLVFAFLYYRQQENLRLDGKVLQSFLTEQETNYYINEYKKLLVAQLIYETMAEKKNVLDLAREVVKNSREK